MTLIHEIDYGTPASQGRGAWSPLTIDGQPVTVPAGTSIMRAAMDAGIQMPKLCATDMRRGLRLLPPLPGRDRGPRRHARLLHHAGRAGHGRVDPDRAAEADPQGRDGALHLRPSARLPDLRRQRRLRAAGHGGRRRPARGALRLRRREPSPGQEKDEIATRTSPSTRRNASSARAASAPARKCRAPSRSPSRAAASTPRSRPARMDEDFLELRMRVLRRLRAGLPDRDACRRRA